MSKYHATHLALSKPQVHKLARGERIQVKPHQVGCGHVHHLTAGQMKRLHSAVTKGKGMRMHFTQHQIHHNMRHGTGFWDSIKSGISSLWNVAKKPLASLASKGVEALAGRYLPPGIAQDAAKYLGNEAISKITGTGRARRRGGRLLGGSFHTHGRGMYV